MTMRIKKHTNKNEYLLTEQGMWVRNFTKKLVPFLDLNKTIQEKDHALFLRNEYHNCQGRYTWIDSERFYHPKIVVISDGYGFKENHKRIVESLPQDVTIIGTHGALAKWDATRSMNYYVVNNPYPECMAYLPRHRLSLPKCIASTRTNYEFLAAYRGMKYRYVPVNEANYSGVMSKNVEYQIDDFRNPICAALVLSHYFGVETILTVFCDNAFADERPGAEKIHNGLYIYPPQKIVHGLIEGCFYWLFHRPHAQVAIADHSNGPLYENAAYIQEDMIVSYLQLGALDDKKE